MLSGEIFSEDKFLENVRLFDWGRFRDCRVLVRGCGSSLVPPWAYMVIASRLAGVAGSVRFGNEHDNIVVFRKDKRLDDA